MLVFHLECTRFLHASKSVPIAPSSGNKYIFKHVGKNVTGKKKRIKQEENWETKETEVY